MATSSITITYGTETAMAGAARLNSIASGQTFTLGTIDNSTAGAYNYKYNLNIVLNTTGVSATGTVEVYLLESTDDTDWTDGIDADATGNQETSRKNARLLGVFTANANSQTLKLIFDLVNQQSMNPVVDPAKFHGLMVKNISGATLAASGHSATYVPMTITVTS